MTRDMSRNKTLDAKLKAAFDEKAAEPVPEHIIELVDELETPPVPKAS